MTPVPPPGADRRKHLIRPLRAAVVAGALLLGATACAANPVPQPVPPISQQEATVSHPYIGMWVTADGHIRQELLPDGRYDEARGVRASAYTGDYQVTGTTIDYQDDTGFTADGRFDGEVLHHGGYVFYREGSPAHRAATVR